MNNNLFQNDHITGNSIIGFEFRGQFKDDENILLTKLKDILNREITFSNVDFKLIEPTNNSAVLIKDGTYYEIKTPAYSYFEALFVLPKIFELTKSVKDYKSSYMYFKLGFNENFIDISKINLLKFILEFNEDYIFKHLVDNSKDGTLEKLSDIKPKSLEFCVDSIKSQIDSMKFDTDEDSSYGIGFEDVNLGFVKFKYADGIDYRGKWEELLKCINHTIITLYNCTENQTLTEDEVKKIDELNKKFKDTSDSFGCYDLFKSKYKSIKITSDLNPDSGVINVIFPSIKDKLFDLVIKNNIKEAEVNYDSDLSRLQIKNLELKNCYHISGVDIVESELKNCSLKECDIYDTKIEESTVNRCNLFGYANCNDCKIKDTFVSRNIVLKDCIVSGKLGKMGGTMKGGVLKDTTLIKSMSEIDDKVEKSNVNEIE